jgi:hypothetical protein
VEFDIPISRNYFFILIINTLRNFILLGKLAYLLLFFKEILDFLVLELTSSFSSNIISSLERGMLGTFKTLFFNFFLLNLTSWWIRINCLPLLSNLTVIYLLITIWFEIVFFKFISSMIAYGDNLFADRIMHLWITVGINLINKL